MLTNIKLILEAADASLDNIVKVIYHPWKLNDFTEYNNSYENFFNESLPVRTTVGSDLSDVIKVEIEVISEI